MGTIIIKNLSTLTDEAAVRIVRMQLSSKRDTVYSEVVANSLSNHHLKMTVEESAVENKTTYTITEKWGKGE